PWCRRLRRSRPVAPPRNGARRPSARNDPSESQRTAPFPFASPRGMEAGVSSIVSDEVKQFAAQAGDWWDPDGPEAMLHKLNPVRLKYVRDQVDQHWQADECSRTPLEGKTALDV